MPPVARCKQALSTAGELIAEAVFVRAGMFMVALIPFFGTLFHIGLGLVLYLITLPLRRRHGQLTPERELVHLIFALNAVVLGLGLVGRFRPDDFPQRYTRAFELGVVMAVEGLFSLAVVVALPLAGMTLALIWLNRELARAARTHTNPLPAIFLPTVALTALIGLMVGFNQQIGDFAHSLSTLLPAEIRDLAYSLFLGSPLVYYLRHLAGVRRPPIPSQQV